MRKVFVLACLLPLAAAPEEPAIGLAQGLLSGEPTEHGIILQARLTGERREDGGIAGAAGVARFELSRNADFAEYRPTEWREAAAAQDFIVKLRVDGLEPATRYHYRLRYGRDREATVLSEPATFETLAGPAISRPVTFAVVSCLNYERFHFGGFNAAGVERSPPYDGRDKALGYPALSYLPFLAPQFVVYNGDNVYYDQRRPGMPAATEPGSMRFRWQRQLSQPRLLTVLRESAGFWMKDDHDFRHDDADHEGDEGPSPAEGIAVFREQVPVVDPDDRDAVTYRTRRVSRELELWFLEGRDYRSPNAMPDGPGKSIWGAAQTAWLKRTLVESDATFKLLMVPTPLVGPDKGRKSDNHTNFGGFRHEAQALFAWLEEEGFSPDELFIVTGDRHWQYHSIHPSGYQEFSAGALSYTNAQPAIRPGNPQGTDPDARVRQPYATDGLQGGFLLIDVHPAAEGRPASLAVRFFDEWGRLVHRHATGD